MTMARPAARRGWAAAAVFFVGIATSAALLGLLGRMELRFVPLAPVALVPWLLVLERTASLRQALAAGLAMSLSFSLILFGWFAAALHGYTHAPRALCWLLLALVAVPLLAPQFVTFALARHLAHRRAAAQGRRFLVPALVPALVYVGSEWLLPKLFADTLGHGLYAARSLRQVADLAGAPGLTLLILIANESVLAAAQALLAWRRHAAALRPALLPLGLLAVLAVGASSYGRLRYQQVSERLSRSERIPIGVVQANLTHYDQLAAEVGTFEAVRRILDAHYDLSDQLLRQRKPELLVWPETVYPTTFGSPKSQEGAEFDRELGAFIAQRGVPLVFGAYDADKDAEFNAAVFLAAPHGTRLEFSTYRKTLLFPLTEWVPEWLDGPFVRRLLPWTGHWKRGPGAQAIAFPLRSGRPIHFAPLICYEDIFPGYVADAARQGAELLLTLSNDSWFAGTPGPRLHLVVAAFRSIETRLAQVRATNSGISALIDPTGEILDPIEDNQRDVRILEAPLLGRSGTLAVAWGDWLGPTALLLGLALLLGPALLSHRSAGQPSSRPARR